MLFYINVINKYLDVRTPLPAVCFKVSGDMNFFALGGQKRLSKRCFSDSEGYTFQASTVPASKNTADMTLADNIGLDHPGICYGKAGLGISGTKGANLLQEVDKVGICPLDVQDTIDAQAFDHTQSGNLWG